MRVAVIHDWLVAMRGGERCLELICSMYPNCEIFTLFYDSAAVSEQLRSTSIRESFLNRLPWVRKYYRYLLPLYPLAVRDLAAQIAKAHQSQPFDLVISVSHCAAKNVPVPSGVAHLCYCLTPMRYIWDQYESYFSQRWYEPITRLVAARLRSWDRAGSSGVTHYLAISEFIAQRIQRYYGREASVVYPPIDLSLFRPSSPESRVEDEVFLCVNALVPYKNTHVVVDAFKNLPYRLLVVGRGPELSALQRRAGDNVEFLGWCSLAKLQQLYKSSKALIFAAEEDFGMTPVEMQASGRPVIAFAKGGVLETVVDGQSGLFFSEATSEAVAEAVVEFISRQEQFSVDNCVEQASKFSAERFMLGFERAVTACLKSGTSNQESSVEIFEKLELDSSQEKAARKIHS